MGQTGNIGDLDLDIEIEATGYKKEQLLKLCVKHLLERDYRFTLFYVGDGLGTIDFGNEGRIIFDNPEPKAR